jgi:hypothetical protein
MGLAPSPGFKRNAGFAAAFYHTAACEPAQAVLLHHGRQHDLRVGREAGQPRLLLLQEALGPLRVQVGAHAV